MMALKTYKPTTPGQRQLVLVDRRELWKGKPVKALTEGKRATGGRNNLGRITVRFRGGGHKQRVPHGRLQARASSTCRRRSSGSNTIRTARASSRSSSTPTASCPTSSRRSVSRSAIRSSPGEHVDVKPGNAMPLGQHAGRHDRAQRRDEDRQGRPARALGRHLRADRRPRPGLRASCGSTRASSASCTAAAWRRSARCRTRIT